MIKVERPLGRWLVGWGDQNSANMLEGGYGCHIAGDSEVLGEGGEQGSEELKASRNQVHEDGYSI